MNIVTIATFKIYYFYRGKAHSATVQKFAADGGMFYDLMFPKANSRLHIVNGEWAVHSGLKIKPDLFAALVKGIDAADQ